MNHTQHLRKALLSATAVATVAAGIGFDAKGPAFAQTMTIEQITVTARRREESLQDVPISVTAMSGASLERAGVPDLVAVAKTVPNVTLEVSRGTNSTLTAFIRGVGQQDPVAGFEAGVGLYIDDVYLNRPQGTVLDIYDVERIEVLRGPQGTLYGRNTIGGAIKYVTKRLSSEPEFKIRGSVGSYTQLDVVFTASVPVSDTFRIGGSIARLTRDGFGENINLTDLDNYNKDVIAGRLSMEWEPSPDFFLRLSGDYTDDDSDPRQGHRLIPSTSGDPVLDDIFDTRAGLDFPKQEVKGGGVALTAEWQVSDNVTLKNIVAYREDDSSSPIDFDSLPAADVDVPVIYNNKQFSEEFQINYASEKLNGLVGFYYLDASASNEFDVLLFTTIPNLNATTFGDSDTSTWSLFGDVTYDVSDQISVSVGGRYTSDKRSAVVIRRTLFGVSEAFGGSPLLFATTSNFEGSETFKEFTPRASIAWAPNDDHNVYFTYSKGFKGGSFDPRGQTTAAPDLDGDGDIDADDIFEFMLFEPETVDSFELGWKASLLDNRVNFSLAGFYADYKDVQIPGSAGFDSDGDGTIDSFIGITSNAASADIKGIEFEGQALVGVDVAQAGDDLTFAWSLGYIDAEYNEFINAFGVDVADQQVFQNTPKWTLSGTLTYGMPMTIGSADGRLTLLNRVSYRSKTSQFETPNPFLDQPGYALWDVSLVWEDNEDRWQFGIHGKNLTDKDYIVAGYNFVDANLNPTLGTEGTLTAFYGNPRTVTATLQFKF
ncbi:MAG: TonB-dependent receptor [Alphaproteobacteria bacterium]|nr:MAG: TonB-dependent receptor [Alphaproteobacteria bacterium]